jgi:hypothetical protein
VEQFVALYYFHLRDGEDLLLDPDGRELVSAAAIESATLIEARSIIGSDAAEGTIKLSYRIDVEDASGRIVHSLEFEDAVEIVRGPAPTSIAG